MFGKRVFCAFLAVLLLCSGLALAEPAIKKDVELHFFDMPNGELYEWNFPFDETLFLSPSSEYNHTLAQMSIGLAIASFRAKGDCPEETITHYLQETGFEQIEPMQYDTVPTSETIGTAMANKKLADGSTLIAIGVSGGNYKNEWLSNFSIGMNEEHTGFQKATQLVLERFDEYIKKHQFSGRIKVWISGYSRAAAVSNLVAAALLERGNLIADDIFAYTFATPFTTKDPNLYPQLFNIVGMFDPVASVPFLEWGFYRKGLTLTLPAQETDSGYLPKYARAAAVYEKIHGQPYPLAPERNWMIFRVFEILVDLVDSPETYEKYFEPVLKQLWTVKKDPIKLLGSFFNLLNTSQDLNRKIDDELGAFTSFVNQFLYEGTLEQLGLSKHNYGALKLLNTMAFEHLPSLYVSWLFSDDDPVALYPENGCYRRLFFSGPVDLTVYNSDGTAFDMMSYKREDLPLSLIDTGSKSLLTLPGEKLYRVVFTAKQQGVLQSEIRSYFGTTVAQRKMIYDEIAMEAGETFSLIVDRRFILDPEMLGMVSSKGQTYYPSYDSWNEETFVPLPGKKELSQATAPNMLLYLAIVSAVLLLGIVTGFAFLIRWIVKKRRRARSNEKQDTIES
ncbi:MAG: hypothetical protein RR301_04020 [Clostridia bacterium]